MLDFSICFFYIPVKEHLSNKRKPTMIPALVRRTRPKGAAPAVLRRRPSPSARRISAATMPRPATPPGRRGMPAMPRARRARPATSCWSAPTSGRGCAPSGRPGRRSSAKRRRSCSAGSNRPGTPQSRRARRRSCSGSSGCRPTCPASTGAMPTGALACGPCREKCPEKRHGPTQENPVQPVRWPKRCAGAGAAPSGRSPPTGPTGRRWSGARTSTRRPGWRPPSASTPPSRNAGPARPVANGRQAGARHDKS